MRRSEAIPARDRKRAHVREAVLDAAVALFAESGFQKTTMQAIADRAGVGVATLFRHFQNKASVLAALIRQDLDEVFTDSRKLVESPPVSPQDGLISFCLCMATLLDKRSKKLRLDPLVSPGLPTGWTEMDEVVAYADEELRREAGALLTHYKRAGFILPEIEVADMTAILFYVYNGHYVDFRLGHFRSRAEFEGRVRARIALLVDPWMSSKSPAGLPR